MSILLVDNQDSFTYNIVDSLRKLDVHDIILATEPTDDQLAAADKIIFSPGPGLPKDFPMMHKILEQWHDKKPILGICLGFQAIATFFRARLFRLMMPVHGQPHEIIIKKPNPLFQDLPKTFTVGLYHSWAVEKKSIRRPLRIDAISQYGVVMAISHRRLPIFGVQFHPESYISEYGLNILKNFVAL